MKYLHSMVRIADVKASLNFYENLLGLTLLRKKDYEGAKFSLYFLATAEGEPEIELTHNWGESEYTSGNAFGHFAFQVDNIYDLCEKLEQGGVTILRPPRDGHMAFVKDPNGISIELLQKGESLPVHPKWSEVSNTGSW